MTKTTLPQGKPAVPTHPHETLFLPRSLKSGEGRGKGEGNVKTRLFIPRVRDHGELHV